LLQFAMFEARVQGNLLQPPGAATQRPQTPSTPDQRLRHLRQRPLDIRCRQPISAPTQTCAGEQRLMCNAPFHRMPMQTRWQCRCSVLHSALLLDLPPQPQPGPSAGAEHPGPALTLTLPINRLGALVCYISHYAPVASGHCSTCRLFNCLNLCSTAG
jgi:hypothetical protein